MKRIIFAMMLVGLAFSVADPSAVYCEQMGYVYSTVQTAEGDAGMCRMPSGQEVDAWAFYRGEISTEYSYCVREGLGIKSVTEDMGTWTAQYAVCVYSNGTEVKLADLLDLEDEEAVTPIEEYNDTESVGDTTTPETTPEEPEEPTPECTTDEECAEGNVCIEGTCVEIPAEGPGPVVPEEPLAPEPEPEPAPEPAAEETSEFPWIAVLAIVVVVILAYWFFIRK